jgi:YD repeat-containing protein
MSRQIHELTSLGHPPTSPPTVTTPAAFSATGNFGFSYDALSRRTQMTRPNGKYVIALGGKQEFLKHVKQNAALPVVREQLEIFEKDDPAK